MLMYLDPGAGSMILQALAGGLAGLGISPLSGMRVLISPSTLGTADSRASVYGWLGPSKICLVVPSSMIRPRYMTAIRSLR